MSLFPIIPIWIMVIICAILIIVIIKYNKKSIKQIIMVVLIFLINLRIMIPTDSSQVMANNLDVLFVIDNTISMIAEDYDGTNTRLYGVKKDCNYIIKRLNGAKFSLITFNNTAKIVTPYTKDANITMESIDIIKPISEIYAKGSSLNTPIDTMITSLKSSQKKDNRTRILFFISDGEITDESTLESFKEISKYVDNGAVLGYGTTSGGYMKNNNSYSQTSEYIMDNSSKALSKIDENNLKSIASDINIEYIHMDKQSRINSKLKEIENLISSSMESSDKSTYDDTYYFLIAPLLILLMLEFNKFRRKTL